MSANEQTPLSQTTSVVRNTLGREQAPQNLVRPVPDEDLREYCDKNCHQILPIIAEKLHQEMVQQEKLKAVKARLNFEEASQYSESETPNRRRNLKERLGPRGARTRSISPKQRRGRSKSPKEKGPKRRTVFKRLEKGRQKAAIKVLVLRKHKCLPRNIITKENTLEEQKQNQKAKEVQEGTGSQNKRSKSQAWRMTYPNQGQTTSVARNTLGREQAPQNLVRPFPDEDLREYLKARLNFEEASQYSESETPNRRRNLKERLGPRGAQTRSISPEQRRGRSKSPKEKGPERRTVFKRLEKGRQKAAIKVLVLRKHKCLPRNIITKENTLEERKQNQKAKEVQEGTRSQNKRSKSQAWRMTYPNQGHIKTYDGSEDPEDHLKIFQAAAKTERWAMPTWCHMFNSTLTGNARVWFNDLPKESIDSYNDLKKAFLENYLQQKKCIKDPMEIHNIKQKNGESTKEFVRRYKLECRDVNGASKCMKISGFMHGITNPELIKRLHDKIPVNG
uniref:Reverse transcriptase domain-containing protein n=1 Tax=Tanacetum cinerariifolium TaxID=118510 RepID=A0A6L2KLN9_TANCI|nr:reverse transcriptase domain-containing protein [Tanacetum cinerariifolium]